MADEATYGMGEHNGRLAAVGVDGGYALVLGGWSAERMAVLPIGAAVSWAQNVVLTNQTFITVWVRGELPAGWMFWMTVAAIPTMEVTGDMISPDVWVPLRVNCSAVVGATAIVFGLIRVS